MEGRLEWVGVGAGKAESTSARIFQNMAWRKIENVEGWGEGKLGSGGFF